MKVKTSELIGDALDWVVIGLLFEQYERNGDPIKPWVKERHDAGEPCGSPSTNRDIGYEILETEQMALFFSEVHDCWMCSTPRSLHVKETGPTSLIAICRCFVASKKGGKVEIPDILLPPGVTPL